MAAKKNIQSVEPKIADLVNGWLRSYNLDYKLEQESLNTEIDQALNDYYSKNGGTGGNRPDAKLLLQDKNGKYYPVLIEYKGYKNRLVKLDAEGKIENKKKDNTPNFKNINTYAVNGAVHYANALLHYTKALSMMDHGYAAIIIQNSAGNGKAIEYNKKILKHSTLLASIKMPVDLFVGKSSVQTNVYVFKVGEAHQTDDIVKFIDFSVDGYTRTNRKKAKINLRDTDRAKDRYQEVVDLVRYGREKLNIFTEKEYYEGHIDPENGADWNQSAPIDTKPTLDDFKKTVSDYLAYEVANLLKNQPMEDKRLKK